MKKVKEIEKVLFIDNNNEFMFIGVNSKAKVDSMINHGDKLLCLKNGSIIKEIDLSYFYILLYHQGVIFNIKEGGSLFYYDLENIVEILPSGSFFQPSQERMSYEYFLLTEMDEVFNQKYFIYSVKQGKRELPKLIKLLLNEYFLYYNIKKSNLEVYSRRTLKLCWDIQFEGKNVIDKRNKVFGDINSIYVPMSEGRLISLNIKTGNENWQWNDGEEKFVSFGQVQNTIYRNYGRGITVIDKKTGKTIGKVNFIELEGKSFQASGLIWCFDEILVVKDSFSGEIVVIDRGSLEIIYRKIVDQTGIGDSKDSIRFKDNYLYVLGMNRTVHIYELNTEVTV